MNKPLTMGIVFTLLSGLFYSLQAVIYKEYAVQLPPLPVVIFFQSVVPFILLTPILFIKKSTQTSLKHSHLPLHFLRALLSLSISYLLFYAVQFIPLVNAMLLLNTAPLLIPLVAYLACRQSINHALWLPLWLGFIGAALTLSLHHYQIQFALLLPLLAALCWASAMLSIRKLAMTNSTYTITLYYSLISTIISGLIAIKFWVPISTQALMILCLIGICYFLTQYTAAFALKYITSQLMASLFYVNIIYATLFSIFVWQDMPKILTLFGGRLIIVGGMGCIFVEHRSTLAQKKLFQEESLNAS